jgi:hypothetical protein
LLHRNQRLMPCKWPCQTDWMVFWWYSAIERSHDSAPLTASDLVPGFTSVAVIRAWHAVDIHGEVKRSCGGRIWSRRKLITALVAVRRGWTACVIVETPTTLLMPRCSSLPHGSNCGTPRFTYLEPLHRGVPRLSHQWSSFSPAASVPCPN